jgi:hypothetical protein
MMVQAEEEEEGKIKGGNTIYVSQKASPQS